jgi:hypothetical protein
MPGKIIDLAMTDPISAVLILIGAALVGVGAAVFGYLTLGAAASLFVRPGSGRSPPPEAK